MNVQKTKLWEEKKLEDVSEVIRGITFPSNSNIHEQKNGFVACLRTTNVQNTVDWENIWQVPEKYVKNNEKIIQINDILISNANSLDLVGKVSFVDKIPFKTTWGSFITVFRALPNIDPKFLFYQLRSKKNRMYLRSIASTTTNISNISISKLKKIPIILPPLKIQQKIASILENANELKEMREKADELTKDYLKAIFQEMFGGPVTNSKKWEIKKMKDISKKIVSGTTPKGGKEVYVEKGTVFFRSQNVWKNRLSLDDVAHIDNDTHAKMIRSSLKNKDILMTKTGRINTENSSLGRAAMFLGEDNSANINGHVYLIRLQENIIPEFVLFIITTNEYREYIRSICVGAIDKRQINKEHLQNFPIIFPPIELQKKFVSIVKEVEVMKEQQKQSRIQIHNLFNYLMQKAFKGELAC